MGASYKMVFGKPERGEQVGYLGIDVRVFEETGWEDECVLELCGSG
jgi:hypothetical protein